MMFRPRFASYAARLLLVFLVSVPLAAATAQTSFVLIQEHGAAKSGAAARDELNFLDDVAAISRFVPVELTGQLTERSVAKAGDRLILNLFPDLLAEAVIERAHTDANGTFVIRAAIGDPLPGYVIMSSRGGRSLVNINLIGSTSFFRITSHPETGVHYLVELDKTQMDEYHDCPTEIPPPPGPDELREQERIKERLKTKELGPDDHATIDVLIVYTPAAAQWADQNESGIANTIAQSMESAQLVSENSQLHLTYRLVHSRLIDYTESSSPNADLRRLTARPDFNPWGQTHDGEIIPGYMYEVHTWRNQYGADLVAMFPLLEGVGGLGWQLMDPGGRPDYGFSLTRVQQASWTYTHVHEMGHNMGAHHHKEQSAGPGPGIFSYSAGWRWTGADQGHYASVMTYEGAQYFDDGIRHDRAPYFSSPLVTYQEVPTGHPEDGDNARTIRETKHVVAGYRHLETLAVEGLVLDEAGEPMHNARVSVAGQGAMVYTFEDGSFSFPFLPPGEHRVSVSKPGYYTIGRNILIEEGESLQLLFEMLEVVDSAVSGFVASANEPTIGLDGAILRFSRAGEVYATPTVDGFFVLEDIPGGFSYRLMVSHPGYRIHFDEIPLGTEPMVIENIYLERAFLAVEEIRAEETDDHIDIEWDTPSFIGEFRHDGGNDTGGLGFSTGENSLLGGAYRRNAWIRRVTWLPSSSSVERANLRILALNADGAPDRHSILYQALDIDSRPGQWNEYALSETLHAPYGFFIGVGGSGAFFLRTDEYKFSPGTNFRTSDIGRFDLIDMAEGDFQRNYFIRAHGYDFGPWLTPGHTAGKHALVYNEAVPEECPLQPLTALGGPLAGDLLDEPVAYHIYLDDFDNPWAENVTQTEFRFSGLPHDRYYAGVQAVYPAGLSEITTKRIFSGPPFYILTLGVHPAETGVAGTEGRYEPGKAARLNAIPMAGYMFSHWEDEQGREVSADPQAAYVMPERDVQLTAVFRQDPEGKVELKVFPNPASDRLTIVADKNIDEIRLYNLWGQLLYYVDDYNESFHQIRVSGYTEGLYILRVRTSDGWINERVHLIGLR